MFGLFKKREKHMRNGVVVPDTYQMSIHDLFKWWLEQEGVEYQDDEQRQLLSFVLKNLSFQVYWEGPREIRVWVELPDLNINKCHTTAEKAHAYRCLDYVAFHSPGCRPFFDPETGVLNIGFSSFKYMQSRADVLIDLTLFIVEDGVRLAHEYLGLSEHKVQQPLAAAGGFRSSMMSGFHNSTTEALVAWLTKRHETRLVGQDGHTYVVQSGPITFEVPDPGWPNLCRIRVGSREFVNVYQDQEKYVEVQRHLDKYRQNSVLMDSDNRLIPYFEDTGTLVLSTAALALPGTDMSEIAQFMLVDMSYAITDFAKYTEQLPAGWLGGKQP